MKVLLDCGSYSAFADGFTIDLGAYIAFIENNRRWLHRYISLDQIPGKNGRRGPDPEAAKRSYANHRKMLDAGLAPGRWYTVRTICAGLSGIWLTASSTSASPRTR